MTTPTIAHVADVLDIALESLGVPGDTHPVPVAFIVGLLTGLRQTLDPDTMTIVDRDSTVIFDRATLMEEVAEALVGRAALALHAAKKHMP